MDLYMLALRIIHFFSGVFWVGTVFFFALFLQPRVKQAGPGGAQFMQRLTAPPLTQTMSLSAILVVLTGLVLYWRDSAGFQAAWISTPTGVTFGIERAVYQTAYMLVVTLLGMSIARYL